MTMLATVKTGTDLVIAADSKVSIKGISGKDQNGETIWLDQAYDYATKIAFSVNNFWTIAVAGSANIGELQIKDIVEHYESKKDHNTRASQDQDLNDLMNYIKDVRASYLNGLGLSEDKWESSDLLAFSSDAEGRGVRCWNIQFKQKESKIQEVLNQPSVLLLGSCEYAFTLLFNYNLKSLDVIANCVGKPVDDIKEAIRNNNVLPVKKINFIAMPIQDALDFASFLIQVQVVMERFVPGTPRCGGPIDLAVVHGLPKNEITWLPGKQVQYPQILSKGWRNIVTPIFTCTQCGKYFAPENNLYKAVYEGHTTCMMCRKENGQTTFTPEEKMALFGEEALFKKSGDI